MYALYVKSNLGMTKFEIVYKEWYFGSTQLNSAWLSSTLLDSAQLSLTQLDCLAWLGSAQLSIKHDIELILTLKLKRSPFWSNTFEFCKKVLLFYHSLLWNFWHKRAVSRKNSALFFLAQYWCNNFYVVSCWNGRFSFYNYLVSVQGRGLVRILNQKAHW